MPWWPRTDFDEPDKMQNKTLTRLTRRGVTSQNEKFVPLLAHLRPKAKRLAYGHNIELGAGAKISFAWRTPRSLC
jgi:hypothetical protein